MRFFSDEHDLNDPKIVGLLFLGAVVCIALSVGVLYQWHTALLIMKGWFLFDAFKIVTPFIFLIKRDTKNFWRRSALRVVHGAAALVLFVGLYKQEPYAYLITEILLFGFAVAFFVAAVMMVWRWGKGKK